MPDNDDAEMKRLCALHDKFGAHVDALITDGNNPTEVAEAMLTIAVATMLKVVGYVRTGHALLSAAGPIRDAAMLEEQQPTQRTH